MSTTYRTCAVNELTETDWQAWADLVNLEPANDSPFFRPELARTVSEVRNDVAVAVIEKSGRAAGFLPMQRRGHSMHPVVGRLTECQGAIVAPETKWSACELLRASGIESWHFDHLPESQIEFCRYRWGHTPSPIADLSRGYAAYRQQLKATGSSLSDVERKSRKLGREVGELRFLWHDPLESTLTQLIEWKSAQHRRTKMLEIFRHKWLRQLIQNLRSHQTAEFSAPLAALYAGDKLVAVHFGLQTSRVLHIWFPAYSTDYEKYSPGLILLLHLAEQAAERNVQRIEFGPGESRYKENFKTGDVPVYEGLVGGNPLRSAAYRAWYDTKRCIRESKYRAQLEAPLNVTRRFRQWMAFR